MVERGSRGLLAAAGCVALALAAAVSARPASQVAGQIVPAAPTEIKATVPADAGWFDTGIDVVAGEELRFAASGEIDLQRGNPAAVCGPEGLDLVTVEQPVPNANLGALIGRITQLVASRIDEDSGQEVRDEIFILFVIGPDGSITVPFKGRLFLGINENGVKDNAGEFSVVITRRPV
ncbi:MAG TPA: hypothetical protein VLJ16_02505 [Acidobacteriota bacterium]|nr:hypothetical protein [Acidobacteriota bacterium]